MGMILFTQSGTFKPSDHGLSVGDAIQVLAIGGGAGGGGVTDGNKIGGTAGSASSLGSLVTADGGAANKYIVAGGISGAVPISSSSAATLYFGGQGGNGWMPGYVMPASWSTAAVAMAVIRGLLSPATGLLPATMSLAVGQAPSFLPVPLPPMVLHATSTSYSRMAGDGITARTDARGGTGECGYYNGNGSTALCGGVGGYGYGAGGGGGCNLSPSYSASGGGAGTLSSIRIILTSSHVTSSHTVTVGEGGSGAGSSLANNGNDLGGGGASGAVAVFW